MSQIVYIVIATRENVFQDTIGGEFIAHPDKEILKVFNNIDVARKFVSDAKLKKPLKKPYGDTIYYENGNRTALYRVIYG